MRLRCQGSGGCGLAAEAPQGAHGHSLAAQKQQPGRVNLSRRLWPALLRSVVEQNSRPQVAPAGPGSDTRARRAARVFHSCFPFERRRRKPSVVTTPCVFHRPCAGCSRREWRARPQDVLGQAGEILRRSPNSRSPRSRRQPAEMAEVLRWGSASSSGDVHPSGNAHRVSYAGGRVRVGTRMLRESANAPSSHNNSRVGALRVFMGVFGKVRVAVRRECPGGIWCAWCTVCWRSHNKNSDHRCTSRVR